MIIVLLCTLLVPAFFGRHWTHFMLGAIFGLVIAVLIGLFMPYKVLDEVKFAPESVFKARDGSIGMTFIKGDKKFGQVNDWPMNICIGDYDLLTYQKLAGDSYLWYLQFPHWECVLTVKKETLRQINVL